MSPLDEQIEAVTAILRANGGVVGIDPNAPEYVKKAFLEMILGCRDCRKAMMGRKGSDTMLKINAVCVPKPFPEGVSALSQWNATFCLCVRPLHREQDDRGICSEGVPKGHWHCRLQDRDAIAACVKGQAAGSLPHRSALGRSLNHNPHRADQYSDHMSMR